MNGAKQRKPLVKQRRQAVRLPCAAAKDFHISAMPVTIKDQEVNDQHLIHVFCPSLPYAEIQRALRDQPFHLIEGIQRYLALIRTLVIFGPAKPCDNLLILNLNSGVNQLIRQVRNLKDRKKAVRDQFVNAFMSDDPSVCIVIREFVVPFHAADHFTGLQKGPGRSGRMPDFTPVKTTQVLYFLNNLSVHTFSHLPSL